MGPGPDEDVPVYVEYKPPARDFFDVPRVPLYLVMAMTVVVVVTYAIVGHLIKDLLHHCLDFILGPQEQNLKESSAPDMVSPAHIPTPIPLSHPNAFHLWDQDDVVIPLSPEESLQSSPLLAVIPYIPHFFNNPPLPPLNIPHPHIPHMYLPHSLLPQNQLSPIWSPIKMSQEAFF